MNAGNMKSKTNKKSGQTYQLSAVKKNKTLACLWGVHSESAWSDRGLDWRHLPASAASTILHSNTWIFHKAPSIQERACLAAEFITPAQTATHAPDRSSRLRGLRNSPWCLPPFHPWGRSTITGCSPKSPEKCCQGHFLLIIACWRDSPVSHAYHKNEQMKAHHINTFPRSLHVYMPSRLIKKKLHTQNTFRSLPVTNCSNSKIIPSYFTYVNEVCWSWPKVSPPPVPIQPPFFPS